MVGLGLATYRRAQGGPYDRPVQHKERREHLRRLLDDLSSQRKVDNDQLLMELIHLVLELDDEIGPLCARLAEPKRAT